MKFKRTAHCEMFVRGLDMTCPLCQVVVRSGERHECEVVEEQPAANPGRPRSKAAIELEITGKRKR